MVAELRQRLDNDLKQAMKSGDKVKRTVIRLVLSAVQNAEISKQSDLEDGDILGLISKEVRQREESIEAFKQGNRQDLIDTEEAEMAILEDYLPQQMAHDEIVAEARRIIADVGAQGLGDKGKVMQKIIGELKGKADGREINTVVTELLSS